MNLVERLKFHRALNHDELRIVRSIDEIHYMLKVGIQGHKPPPTTYRPKFENDNIRGRIIPTSEIPLEERVAGIPYEIRNIFEFTLRHPEYDSRKLRYVLDNYSMMYEDYLNHFLE